LKLPFERVGTLLENALDPFVKKQARAVDKLVEHPGGEIIRQSLAAGFPRSFRSLDSLHHDARTVYCRVGLPERRDHAIAATLRRAEIDKQHLIYDFAQLSTATRQVHRRQLAFEDRVLEVVPVVPHRLVDLSQPLLLATVV